MSSKSELQTLTNAIRVLQEVSTADPWLGVSELARRLDLPRSTTHRLVKTLATHGFLDAREGRYRLGLALLELTSGIVPNMKLRQVALPQMRHLAHVTQDTVHLAVRRGMEIVYIEKIEPDIPFALESRVGRRAPAHCTALGKAMLAFEPASVIEQGATRLKGFTGNTITAPDAIRAELERVRARGYAIDDEEFKAGIRCVAAPINALPGMLAAISVTGPTQRLGSESVRQVGARLAEVADAISMQLGYRPLANADAWWELTG